MDVKFVFSRGMDQVPNYATPDAAAVDLRAAVDSEVTLNPGEKALIPTGISIEPQAKDVVAIVAGRSGLGIKHGVTLSNGIGVIDADYRGEICVGLINHGSEPFSIERGDRIAQLFFLPVIHANFIKSLSLSETDRGAGGFGSTGTK